MIADDPTEDRAEYDETAEYPPMCYHCKRRDRVVPVEMILGWWTCTACNRMWLPDEIDENEIEI